MYVTIRTHYNVTEPDERIAVVGNTVELGQWDPQCAVVGVQIPENSSHWFMRFQRTSPDPIRFKLLVLRGSEEQPDVARWQVCGDRELPDCRKVFCPWDTLGAQPDSRAIENNPSENDGELTFSQVMFTLMWTAMLIVVSYLIVKWML